MASASPANRERDRRDHLWVERPVIDRDEFGAEFVLPGARQDPGVETVAINWSEPSTYRWMCPSFGLSGLILPAE
jgi:hypothetical protein